MMPKSQKTQDETSHLTTTGANGRSARFVGRWQRQRENAPSQLEQAYNHFLDAIKDMLNDFTTLEVNTVLASNISADHPLIALDFLQQIGDDLHGWFTDHATQNGGQKPLSPENLQDLKELTEHLKHLQKITSPASWSVGGKDWIATLGAACTDCLNFTSTALKAEEAAHRAEYRRFLRYLQKFLELCTSDAWVDEDMRPGRERQQLRKLWELVGTKCVYAQTVIGLDADIVARINAQLFHYEPRLSQEQIEGLIRFHNYNTEASARGRDSLIATIMATLRTVLGR
jgi:hypothetical protein